MPSFKNFEDITSKPGAFDASRQVKISFIFYNVLLNSSKSIESLIEYFKAFLYVPVILLRQITVKFVKCDWQLSHCFLDKLV